MVSHMKAAAIRNTSNFIKNLIRIRLANERDIKEKITAKDITA